MMRKSTFSMLVVCLGVGFSLFVLKYKVMDLTQHHAAVKKKIRETKEAIHVLKAEWAHLNDPKRLQELCARHLKDLGPPKSVQIIAMDDFAPQSQDNQSELDRVIAEALDEKIEIEKD